MTPTYSSPYPTASTLQQQQFFPQPQGNAYLINSSLEVANIPISGSITLALCTSENLLYLKSMQNGNPVFLAYKITPYEKEPVAQNYESRIKALEDQLKKIQTDGGKFNDLL